MQIRLHGTATECEDAVERMRGAFTVVAVHGPYSDRGTSSLVRVYLDVSQHTQ